MSDSYASVATNPNNDGKQRPHEYSQQLSWHFLPSENTPWKEDCLTILRCRNNVSRSFNVSNIQKLHTTNKQQHHSPGHLIHVLLRVRIYNLYINETIYL